jgi:two-component sensor histidine kinase
VREFDIRIKDMHAHMRDTKLKEEEEELRKREVSRRGKKNLRYVNEISRNGIRSLARLSIAHSSTIMDVAFYVLL